MSILHEENEEDDPDDSLDRRDRHDSSKDTNSQFTLHQSKRSKNKIAVEGNSSMIEESREEDALDKETGEVTDFTNASPSQRRPQSRTVSH